MTHDSTTHILIDFSYIGVEKQIFSMPYLVYTVYEYANFPRLHSLTPAQRSNS